MRTIWFALGLACGASQPVFGQAAAPAVAEAPGNIETSRKLITLLKLDDTYDLMFQPLTPIFAQAVVGIMQGDPETRDALRTLFEKGDGGQTRFVAILSEEFMRSIRTRYPQLKEGAAVEYAKLFTEQELRDLIAFYSSGTGSKALKTLPELQKRIAASAQQVGRAAGEEAGRSAFERAGREMLPKTKPSKS